MKVQATTKKMGDGHGLSVTYTIETHLPGAYANSDRTDIQV